MTVISPRGNGMAPEAERDLQTLEGPRTPQDPQAPNDQGLQDQAMKEQSLKDQEALIAQLGTSQESIDVLVGELRSLEGQLEALTTERNQHRLLHEVCDALDELGKLGGSQLFWGTAEAV